MQIVREVSGDYKTFELTDDELRNAAWEYEQNCDMEDVKSVRDERFVFFGSEVELCFRDTLKEIARKSRRLQSDYDIEWKNACEIAIKAVLDSHGFRNCYCIEE